MRSHCQAGTQESHTNLVWFHKVQVHYSLCVVFPTSIYTVCSLQSLSSQRFVLAGDASREPSRPSLFITDRCAESTSDLESRLGETRHTGGVLLESSNKSPLLITECWSAVNKRVIWSHAAGWATECVKEEGGGQKVKKKHKTIQNKKKTNAAVPTEAVLLDFCSGHSSLSNMVLLGDWLQNFNK